MSEREEFMGLFRDLVESSRPVRLGWGRSLIDDLQRDYILDRERIIDAIREVHRVSWRSIDAENQELAEKIRHSGTHALTVMHHAMRNNERRIMF
jgi:hypothetical protein